MLFRCDMTGQQRYLGESSSVGLKRQVPQDAWVSLGSKAQMSQTQRAWLPVPPFSREAWQDASLLQSVFWHRPILGANTQEGLNEVCGSAQGTHTWVDLTGAVPALTPVYTGGTS